MPKRSFDFETLDKVVAPYKNTWIGFDAEEIVRNEENILVTDGKDNFGLFEYDRPGVYYGHYLFSPSGRHKPYETAKDILGFFFKEFPVRVVLGLTPVEHKGALRLNKKLGFTTSGIINTEAGPHYQVYLKKDDFNYE